MKKILFAIALGAIMVVSCTKELENNTPVGQTVTIRATSEPYTEIDPNGVVTKGTLDAEGHFLWATGDEIGVRLYKGDNYNETNSGFTPKDATFILSGDGGSSEGTFTYSGSESLDWVNWGYAAFYPKFDSNISNENGNVYFHLKNFYDGYVSGTCLMPMVANASGVGVYRPSTFSFKHVGAGLRVTLKDVPADANQASLTVTGKNIAAWYGVNPANAGTDCIAATDGTDDTVYLKFGTASEKRDITLIFPLPTVNLSGGITLKLYYDKSGEAYPVEFWSRTAGTGTTKLPALTRGQLLDMPDITIPVTPEEASAPIWIDGNTKDWSTITTAFTTSDSRILEWKYTTDANNLYLQYKIDKSKITTTKTTFDYNPYIYIGFDTDNDPDLGKAGGGGLGDGMEAKAVIFPWRGPSDQTPQCVIGEDDHGHIDKPADTESTVRPKVGAKIKDAYCFVEVRIPFSSIGITSSTGYITLNHAMDWHPTGRERITIAGGPLPAIITAHDQTVDVGKSVSIGATTTSTGTITYVSADKDIATVDDSGVITGVAVGSTTITMNVAAVGTDYAAGTKTITVTVMPSFTQAIDIDGSFSDWDGITEYVGTLPGGSANTRINAWRMTYDSRNIYFYVELNTEKITNTRYFYVGFDTDRDESHGTSAGNIPGVEQYVKVYPAVANSSPIAFVTGADPRSSVNSSSDGNDGTIQIWSVYGNPTTSTFVELCIPRSKVGLTSEGTVDIAVTYDSYNTAKQSLVLK